MGVGASTGDARTYNFARAFQIGRDDTCEVSLKHDYVSRQHAEVGFEDGHWWVRDLNSANGLFLNGKRVQLVRVDRKLQVRLGLRGPAIWLEVEAVGPSDEVGLDAKVGSELDGTAARRYFSDSVDETSMSERTIIVRRAFKQIQRKQKSRYLWTVTILVAAAIAIGSYAAYHRRQWNQRQELAENLFYSMKSLELEVAEVERAELGSENRTRVHNYRERQQRMAEEYDRFVKTMDVYRKDLSEQDKVILRVTRVFGECDLNMPVEYVSDVKDYIQRWKASERLRRDVAIAQSNGYSARITKEFLAQGLPAQFFYLALQESNFDPYASGRPTYKGIAKGMWQFIPETAVRYGLRIGPLADQRRPDPGDDRDKWEKATIAAASYVKDLYTTDAQASGLLVMACYNWGEGKVLPLVRSLPANPRERNFWRLLRDHRSQIPIETYDYVFYIVSAAVIGEEPALFGFDFDNPLSQLDEKSTQ